MTKDTPVTHGYVTPTEIADDLRLSRMTVYRMIKTGVLPALAIGPRTYRIPADDYAAYKERLRDEGAITSPTVEIDLPQAND